MAHLLEERIAEVRSQARWLLALHAVASTVGLVLTVALLLGLADYLIRFQDYGIRLMCSLAVLLALAWAGYRFWFLGYRRRWGDLQLAQRIERRFPALTDRLSTTVEFLRQSEQDPQAGSVALRRAVIVETGVEIENLDFSQVFDRGPTRRALAMAGAVVLLAVGLAVLAPHDTRIAMLRLVRPLGSDNWPKFYRVEFREAPTRLAVGQVFEVELLRDAEHRLPDEVRMQYRYEAPNGAIEEESEPMHLLNGDMVARKEGVTRPFSYRAAGGDDQSDWFRLEVVEPPRLDSLQLTLHPPAYSGLPAETSDKSLQALRGTRVELAGMSTKKLKTATVHRDAAAPLATKLSPDGYSFSLAADAAEPFEIDKSGTYWIVLEDIEGSSGGLDDRWDIRAIADSPPTVTIDEPAGNIFVTPKGEVPIKVSVKDDLAIHDIVLKYSRSDRSDVEEFLIALYSGPEKVPPVEAGSPAGSRRSGESQSVNHRWSFADLELKPGSQITFWGTAADYLPQVGKSTVRRITFITPQELEERLAQRQSLIFGELQRVLKLQQDARAQTKSLEIQMQQVGQLNKEDIDHAQAAELNQRQVARTLTSRDEGIPAQIADFLNDLASNRVDSPDLERHMNMISSELERLGQEHLTTIQRELTSVIKASQAQSPHEAADKGEKPVPDPLVDKSLASAGENQDQVVASLENMLNELGQWDNFRRFGRDIAQLQRDQDEIAKATKEMAQKTLGRELKDLDQQQQADLKKLSSLQTELSRRLEKVQQQMSQMADSLKQSDPLSSATISDSLHLAQQKSISGQMRQSSDRLDKNQLSQAAQQQSKIGKDLEELMATLSNRREQELARLVKQLRDAEQELARVRSQQDGLRKKTRAAAEKTDPEERKRELERLAREQKQLQEEAARLARKLERLQAEQASRTTGGAAGKMEQAAGAGQQGDAPMADEQAEMAEKDLEEAQQQLAERRRQAEADLAQEQMARMEDSLASLQKRQQLLLDSTKRLDDLRVAEGRLTRAQLGTVNDLARQQQSLRQEVGTLAEKLALAEVINLALEGASKHMARAADFLKDQRTGGDTQKAEAAARARLAQLIEAFAQKSNPKAGEGEQGGGEGGSGGSGGRPDGAQVLTQLKLLKILQEDLNDRFQSLAVAGGEDPDASAAQELADVATEQGKLADLALKLSQPPEANPEDDPEKLPDIRQDGLTPDSPSLDEALAPPIKEKSR